jgi:hypothetical protein
MAIPGQHLEGHDRFCSNILQFISHPPFDADSVTKQTTKYITSIALQRHHLSQFLQTKTEIFCQLTD